MEKFHGKYRIASARLPRWDYGTNTAYFVTICTGKRECFFGKINSNTMELSDAGHVATKLWTQIPAHFPNVALGEFVIMPNHVHGIIIIDWKQSRRDAIYRVSELPAIYRVSELPAINQDSDTINQDSDTINQDSDTINPSSKLDAMNRVSTGEPVQTGGFSGTMNPMLHENLSRIIRWYKGRTCFEIRKNLPEFAWQSRFYDIIIRNQKIYRQISEYIIMNPTQWTNDENYSP